MKDLYLKMDDGSVEAEIARQRDITTISGKAIKKLEELVGNLLAITREAKTHETIRYQGTQEVSELPYDRAMQMVDATKAIYHVMVGLKKLHIPEAASKNHNTVTPSNIEELVQGEIGIKADQYALQPETDPRKELNRLRIINAVYDAIFRTFINHTTTIYMAAGPLRSKEPEQSNGRQVVTLDSEAMNAIMGETRQFVEAVREKKQLLIKGEQQDGAVMLYDLVQSVSRMASVYYTQFGIKLQVDEIPRDVRIKGDVYDITQALLNLFMDKSYVLREVEKPEVNVRCVSLKDKVALCITDNGPLIPHENPDVIFETAEMYPRRTCSDPTVALQAIEECGGEVHVRNSVPPPGVEMEIYPPTENRPLLLH